MKHPQPVQAAKLACPRFWATFFELFLGADVPLAKELWKQLFPTESQPLMYQIARLQDLHHDPDSTRRFGALASPALLMRLCARLAPENGAPRRDDIVALEGRITEHTDSQGRWM